MIHSPDYFDWVQHLTRQITLVCFCSGTFPPSLTLDSQRESTAHRAAMSIVPPDIVNLSVWGFRSRRTCFWLGS